MSTATIYPWPVVDQPMYNSSADTIVANRMVQAATPIAKKMTIDPFTTDAWPLSTEGNSLVMPIVIGSTSSATLGGPTCGATLAAIKSGEWGMVRTYGPAFIPVEGTDNPAFLQGYGLDNATDGYLNALAKGATKLIAAFQIESLPGAYATGASRPVFLLCERDQLGREACEFGAFAT
jgi:hypothetical protein